MGFTGWPAEAIEFYDGLVADNSKSYWTAHKPTYDGCVLGPMQQLLTGSRVPTAVVYDNDLMAIGGLAAAKELGVAVPDQLSVIAWDDTAVARLATPPLSVVTVDVHGLGSPQQVSEPHQ